MEIGIFNLRFSAETDQLTVTELLENVFSSIKITNFSRSDRGKDLFNIATVELPMKEINVLKQQQNDQILYWEHLKSFSVKANNEGCDAPT